MFNVGCGQGYTVLEFAHIVAESLGTDVAASLRREYRVGDTRHSVSDISKLRALGWRPTKSPRESVRAHVDWIRGQHLDRDYAAEALHTLRRLGALRQAADTPSAPR